MPYLLPVRYSTLEYHVRSLNCNRAVNKGIQTGSKHLLPVQQLATLFVYQHNLNNFSAEKDFPCIFPKRPQGLLVGRDLVQKLAKMCEVSDIWTVGGIFE